MNVQRDPADHDLLEAFAATDSLNTFRRLPQLDQEKFFLWIGKAHDEESRWRRIDALVLAMRISCLKLDGVISLASDDLRRPVEPPAIPRSSAAGELLEELQDPELFSILENVIDEFLRARDDDSIEETLEISEAFLVALREAQCLDLFLLLPAKDQGRFLRWIGSTGPITFRLKRIETFVTALKASPLGMGRDT